MERKQRGRLLAILAVALVTLGLVFGASTTALASKLVSWKGDQTFDSDTEIDGFIVVEEDATVTIAEGKTVTVSEGISAGERTLTVTGKGKLVVKGIDGPQGEGAGGSDYGHDGGAGLAAIVGNVIVDGGATIQCTGGAGGMGGEGITPGNGGDGGAGIDGDLTVKGGTAKLAGGSGGERGVRVAEDNEDPTAGKQGNAVTGKITADVIQACDDGVNYEAIEGTTTSAQYVVATSEVEPDPEPAEGQEMFRLYNPYSGEHFYTASAEERDEVEAAGWTYEGVGWKAPVESEVPVYRLYNSFAGDHHYTTSEFEHDMLIELGWTDEGVGWQSAGQNGVPVYRQYNPYATVGTHNYTTSEEEATGLVKLGWNSEGIGWYGL